MHRDPEVKPLPIKEERCSRCQRYFDSVPERRRHLRLASRNYEHGQKTTLLGLPLEIREEIWHHVFDLEPEARCRWCGYSVYQSGAIQGTRTLVRHSPYRARTESVLAALLTCKQIHAEAWHLFYELNILSFYGPVSLWYFLTGATARIRSHVKRVHVGHFAWRGQSHMTAKAFSLLSLCSSLRELYIDFGEDEKPITSPWRDESEVRIFKPILADLEMERMDRQSTPGDRYDVFIRRGITPLWELRGLERLEIRAMPCMRTRQWHSVMTYDSFLTLLEMSRPLKLDELQAIVTRPRPKGLLTRYERARLAGWSYRPAEDENDERMDTCLLETTEISQPDPVSLVGSSKPLIRTANCRDDLYRITTKHESCRS